MNKVNYQKELEKTIEQLKKEERRPSLLLHSCCAPCSSYVLEYLAEYFDITVLYYNPNIFPEDEFEFRKKEQERFIGELLASRNYGEKIRIGFVGTDYRSEEFYKAVKGLEQEPEGGERCFKCYELRLKEAAETAVKMKADYFTTTLSISPLKASEKLNEIGEKISREYGVAYLFSDFKKKNGYKRSVELSKEFSIYRQNYCGCVYSMR